MAAGRLHDPDLRCRLYGTFRGRARGGKHRRGIRLGKNEKHYPSADDVLRYYLNLSLTGGAPYGTTEMAAMHVYEKAFTSRQFGVGQAEAFILFIIVACISGIQVYTTKKREVEA